MRPPSGWWRTVTDLLHRWTLAPLASRRLRSLARRSGDPFRRSVYYGAAEPDMARQWETLVWPFIRDADLTRTVELAPGHGRNSAKLLEHAGALTLVDINPECLAVCRARFDADARVSYVQTEGAGFQGVPDRSATFVYCFDAAVHFEPAVLASYLSDTARILEPGGTAFYHHSNRPLPRGGGFREAPHWRNDMSLDRFRSIAEEAGLEVVRAKAIDWGSPGDLTPELDGLSLLKRPQGGQNPP